MLLSAILQLFCAISTWRLVASHGHLPAAQLATVYGAATLMSGVTVGLLFGLVRFVVVRGLAMLIKSAIVSKLKVHVVVPQARPDLPQEVVLPARVAAEEFELAERRV